ncbi:MAG: adenylate/guanylate cyclase domain-containing protein [Alphaproteobacteria bacterium]
MDRKLAAILAADVAGYSRLMGLDETGTLVALKSHQKDVIEPKLAAHRGRLVKTTGDGFLAEFASVVEAVTCAVEIQSEMARRNAGIPPDRRLELRIGVNLGDVILEGDDIYGDGVNVAARLEALAEPRGILLSRAARDQIRDRLQLRLEDLGEHEVKNIARPVRVYRVLVDGAPPLRRGPSTPRPRRRAMIGGLVALVAIAGALGWYGTREPRGPEPGPPEDPILALPSGPSIAVLPFTNLSDDAGDAYFSDGLTDDIISALSRFSDLRVIARNSTFQFRGGNIDVREIGRKLAVRYVVEGSVRRSQDHLRVTVQLLDAEDGTHLWSETYDRDLTAAEVFAVQDEITERVAGALGSSAAPLWKSQMLELREKRTDSLEAYECVLLLPLFYESFSPDAHLRARDCLERAVKLDPNYSLAWSSLATVYTEEYKYAYNLRPEPLARALAAAQRAIDLDNQNQNGYYALAIINYMNEKDLNSFYALAEHAIALNPNNASVIADLGLWMAYSGNWERGMALMRKAMILNPLHPRWFFFAFLLDHYRNGEYREALTEGLKINIPENPGVQAGLAAVYGQLGEAEKARATLDHILEIQPGFADDPRAWFVKRRVPDELVESLMDGLRKAGLDVAPAEE